jgi:uncharacterized protein (DUF1919 family)
MNYIIISNTCVGQFIIKNKNLFPYNNPFIGSLIPNDLEYIKLINNLEYYLNVEPVIGQPKENTVFHIQNKSKYYLHKSIPLPYPVVLLDDIEIHFIHENDNNLCIDKFKRRLNRTKNIINNLNYKIFVTLSFSEFINNHDNIKNVINEYFNGNESKLNIEKYFIGPSQFNNNSSNYINIEKWDNIELSRDSSQIYNFNDQPFTIEVFSNIIN